jgi:Transglutaminase-like superfamily
VTGARLPPRLSAVQKGQLGIEIVAAYGRVLWLLRRGALPMAVSALRAGPPRTPGPSGEDPIDDGRRLAGGVVRTLAPLPRGSRCLTRALVLTALLARRGVPAEVVLAVRPGPDARLDAHAWVEVHGRALLTPALDYGRLVKL